MALNPSLFPTSGPTPPDNDSLQSTFIEDPLPQGSGFSGFSGFSGSNPGQSGFSGYSGAMAQGAFFQSAISGIKQSTNVAGIMCGLAGQITPNSIGIVEVNCDFVIGCDTNGAVAYAALYWGTGFPPTYGSGVQGTAIGNAAFAPGPLLLSNTASICAIISGLTPGVPIWIDLALAPNVNGALAEINLVSLIAHEVGAGPAGATGPRGASGFSGYSGQQSTSGYSGYCGSQGGSGFSGFSGFSATSGISGYSGQSGFSGFSGFSGSGQSGFSGFSGYSGQGGSFSASGFSGYSGPAGQSGFSGYSAASPGASGFSGYSGFSSQSGFSGPGGVSGFSGYSGQSGFMGLGATSYSNPVDPGQTGSSTGVMMGLAAAFTPIASGVAEVVITGDISNDTAPNGGQVQIRYGTGAAPANGAALVGTTLGQLVKYDPITPSTASQRSPFAVSGIISGMTIGTAYWIDVSLANIGGGNARIQDVTVNVFELGAGRSGTSGFSGYSGFSAASPGASGYSGFSGYSSTSGFSGYSSQSGFSGPSGFSGYSGALPHVATVKHFFQGTTTYTPTAAVRALFVECWGGGAAAGGTPATGAGQVACGGGGGGGAFSAVYLTSLKGSYTIAVGAGGLGVVNGTGNSGGDTTFDSPSVCTAKGGTGGQVGAAGTQPNSSGVGGAGGASANGVGDVKMDGSYAFTAYGLTSYGGSAAAGGGGGSGGFPGGGGAGNFVGPSSAAAQGYPGANGLIRVTEYF